MAAGDIVSAVANTVFPAAYNFQPAAGVTIIVTSVFTGYNSGTGLGQYSRVGLTDGVNISMSTIGTSDSSSTSGNIISLKLGITNSNYLYQMMGGSFAGYSMHGGYMGIQLT